MLQLLCLIPSNVSLEKADEHLCDKDICYLPAVHLQSQTIAIVEEYELLSQL